MKTFQKDCLLVKIMPNRTEMGEVAAADVHERILALLAQKEHINMVFGAAPSQNDVLASLVAYRDIDWSRINAFHMDEYIGLSGEWLKQSFGTYLDEHIFGVVPFRSINRIDPTAKDPDAECARYSALLKETVVGSSFTHAANTNSSAKILIKSFFISSHAIW